ncbi:hypothetical protein MNBD_PLANCTO03-1485 [hydrothermal vent metagenome]|uniref:Uncharacterized protein n=1 Tax=hydrothermal vent metagenome TaxID=652676 RepID=A0A3B1DIQ5_9ZZZZ
MKHEETAPVLAATRRERTGTRYCARIRQAGGLPAVVYGHGKPPVSIAVNAIETVNHLTKGDKIFKIKMEGESEVQVVIIKDLQFDHLGTNIVHADFSRVDFEERIEVRVPVQIVGDSVGLKTAGAMLVTPTNEIEIECLVANLPSMIEVDITDLDAGQILHAEDIALPLPTMKLVTDSQAIVAQIVVQAVIEEVTSEEDEVEGETQPEVTTEKKDDADE